MFAEPFTTPYDLRFVIFGFSVRVQALFWLVALLICASSHQDAGTIFLLICGFFASILIHELGHTFAFRHFGIPSHIVLYWMGGLAIPGSSSSSSWESSYYRPQRRSPWQQVIISFAGPAAGFLFALVIIILIQVTGGHFRFYNSFPVFWDFELAQPHTEKTNTLYQLVHYLLYFNIFWGLVNLLPVFPLDGGQISRELFMMNDPWQGQTRAFFTSMVVAIVIGIAGFATRQQFVGFLFLSLAYSSYMAWHQSRNMGGGGW